MSFQNNVLSFDGTRTSSSRSMLNEQYRSAVTSCRGIVSKQLPVLIGEMFESLDDALYEMADKADSNIRQNAFFDALREIRKSRERIEAGSIQGVLKEYEAFWRSGALTAPPEAPRIQDHEEDFSLLEEDDLEEGLALNNMVSRGESRHAQLLYALNQRFGHMLSGPGLESGMNPLSPGVICQAFHECFKTVQVDIPTKLVVYKQFQIMVIDALGGFYDTLNRALVEAGVMPKLTRRVRRASGHVTAAQHTPPPPQGMEREHRLDSIEDEDQLQEELFSTLKQLLTQRRVSAPAIGTASRVPVMTTGDMVRALSQLQEGAMQEPPLQVDSSTQGGFDVRANLMQVMGVGDGVATGRLSGNDEDAIDVIAMLFEFILEDRNLPDAMKALLSRLQIPMLKVAILDRSFFHSKGHPARRLLNTMAKSAIGWSEQAGKSDGGLYAKMSDTVERVLNEFESDIDLFTRLCDEFNAYIEDEEQGSLVTEQRVTQITQGKEQLNSARHRVFEEINNRLFGHDWIPGPVVTLIKDGWRDVLQLIYLRQGEASPEWEGALSLMDQLLQSVEPSPDAVRRQALLNEIPPLLKGLRSGLKEISYDQHKMARLFKDLQECHIRCLKGDAASAAPVVVNAQEGKEDAVAQAPAVTPGTGEPEPRVDDEFQRQSEQLQVGSWLEIQDAKGMTFRAKLSWRSMVSGTCLFVNRKGMKVMEIPLTSFAAWLRNGKAVPLDGVGKPLMDRALNSMLDVLKRTEAHD